MNSNSSLLDALFTTTQQKVLSLFFGDQKLELTLLEAINQAAAGRGAVQREVQRLLQAGLLEVKQVGRQKFYRANKKGPLFKELNQIFSKTLGIADLLKRSFENLEADVKLAIIYGSIAKKTDTSESDIDVLVVSDDLTLAELFRVLTPLERNLHRKISPTLYTVKEFDHRMKTKNPFLLKVLSGKKIVLVKSDG